MHEHLTCADWSMRMNFGSRFYEGDTVAGIAAGQLNKAAALGVRTIVDGTPVNLGRDICLIREVARRTGLNFIASTGFYYQEEPWLAFRDEEQIYDLLMGDCTDGIQGTDSRPGILKAGVGHAGLTPLLEKVLHATSRVSAQTGLPIFCHHDPSIHSGGAILDLFEGCGVPANRVILGHSGDTTDLDYLTAMLERGCWLGMDRFGFCDRGGYHRRPLPAGMGRQAPAQPRPGGLSGLLGQLGDHEKQRLSETGGGLYLHPPAGAPRPG